MRMYVEATRATVTCDYCDALNDMTVLNVTGDQEVRCSRCGAALGKMGELAIHDGGGFEAEGQDAAGSVGGGEGQGSRDL